MREYLDPSLLPAKAEEGKWLQWTHKVIARGRATKLERHACLLLWDSSRSLRASTVKSLLQTQWTEFGEQRLRHVVYLHPFIYRACCVTLGIKSELLADQPPRPEGKAEKTGKV